MGSCKHKLCCLGNFAAKLCVDDKVITELIHVVKDLERPLLGREVAEKLKLVNRVDTVSSDDYKTKIASKHPQLFTGLSQMRETYTITLKEDAKQFAISVARKVALPLYQKTKDELDMMLEETYCSEGWPDKHSVKDAMRPYWSTRGELTVVQNILLKGTRIVIPSSMRLEILDKIHEGHQGIAKCRERAKSSMWWPGLSREIQDLVQQCRTCALDRDNKPEPLIATLLPDHPWQIVATDLFQMRGTDYLIVTDYYSRYLEVAAITKTTKVK